MSERRARYVGHPDGVDITVPIDGGRDMRTIHVAYGDELPSEIDGLKVPAAFRDGLLEQEANWTDGKRATGAETQGKTAKEGE